MRSARTHTHTQHNRFCAGCPYLLIGEDLEHHERHGKPPEQHVKGAPRRPPEAQMEVLLVFGPLFNGPVPNEGKKAEEKKRVGMTWARVLFWPPSLVEWDTGERLRGEANVCHVVLADGRRPSDRPAAAHDVCGVLQKDYAASAVPLSLRLSSLRPMRQP